MEHFAVLCLTETDWKTAVLVSKLCKRGREAFPKHSQCDGPSEEGCKDTAVSTGQANKLCGLGVYANITTPIPAPTGARQHSSQTFNRKQCKVNCSLTPQVPSIEPTAPPEHSTQVFHWSVLSDPVFTFLPPLHQFTQNFTFKSNNVQKTTNKKSILSLKCTSE